MATLYADPSRCPDCRAALGPSPLTCPACGLTLTGPQAVELFGHLVAVDRLLVDLRARPEGRPSEDRPAGAMSTAAETPPVVVTRPRRGVRTVSVPGILLSLGALCLLVAAVVFLAVAWSWLGVGGRTAVLLVLTATAAALTLWLERRGLRWAAEALSVVTFGLALLDIVGAENAGWLGDLGPGGLTTWSGGALAALGLLATYWTGRDGTPLVSGQVVAVLGVMGLGVGLGDVLPSTPAAFLSTCLLLLGLAGAGHRFGLRVLTVLAGLAFVPWWWALFGSGFWRAVDHPTFAELWGDAEVWPLLAAAGLIGALAWLLRRRRSAIALLGGAALTIVAGALVAPAVDESSLDPLLLGLLAVTVLAGVGLHLAQPWRDLGLLPAVATWLFPAGAAAVFAAAHLGNALWEDPWTTSATAHLEPVTGLDAHPALIPLTALVGAGLAWSLLRLSPRWQALRPGTIAVLAGGVAVAAVAAVAAYDVPRLAPAALALAAGCGLVGVAIRLPGASRIAALATAGVLGALALALGLPSVVLTLLVGAVIAGVGVALAQLALHEYDVVAGDLVAPVGLAFATAAVAELAGLDARWQGVVVVAALGATLLWRPAPVWLGAATLSGVAAALLGLDAAAAGDQDLLVLALTLTAAGTAYVATALLHSRWRWLAAPGGALLAAATWVRLWDLDVDVVEAYTLPSALVLVALGLWHLWRRPEATTRYALLPGLTLATVPSLLRVFVEEPVTWRALLLGLACLALVLVGVRLRWSAPLVVGAVVGALLVVRESGPYAATLPPWVLIAAAGALLTVVGITWEARVRNLRDAGAYLARLR